MDGNLGGKAAQGSASEGDSGERALAQGHQVARADGGAEGQRAQIAELEGRVASAAKTAEATDTLNAEIAKLKQQMADERVEFALRAAGARSVRATKALLVEHDGDMAALVVTESWLFEGAEPTSQRTSQTSAGGAMGLEPAGVAGGNDATYMRRWERIAALADEGKGG